MVLVCFDGSPDSQRALDVAAELFGDRPLTILTVWEPLAEVMAWSGAGTALTTVTPDTARVDDASLRAASACADSGAERARRAGLDAQARVTMAQGSVAHTILADGDRLGADVIVLGTRGLRGLKSALLGSVSHAVVQRASRPVMVVRASVAG